MAKHIRLLAIVLFVGLVPNRLQAGDYSRDNPGAWKEIYTWASTHQYQFQTLNDLFNGVCNEYSIPEFCWSCLWEMLHNRVWHSNRGDVRAAGVSTIAQEDSNMHLALMLSDLTPDELRKKGYTEDQISNAQKFIQNQKMEEERQKKKAGNLDRNTRRQHRTAAMGHGVSFDLDDDSYVRISNPVPAPAVVHPRTDFSSIVHFVPTLPINQEQTTPDTKKFKTLFDYARAGKLEHLKQLSQAKKEDLFVTEQGLSIRDHAAQGFDKAWGKDDKRKASCLAVIRWYDQTIKEKKDAKNS